MESSDSWFLRQHNLYIMKKIGEGSFSSVYLTRVKESSLNDKITLVATKIINKNRVSLKFVDKFLPRELDVLVKLKHPYIVKVYSIYQEGYKVFINMEYTENGDMYKYLEKNNILTEAQIRSWALQILWAFRYMHGLGVVHRDVKCENVLLTNNYNVRIADFGFSRFVSRGRNPGVDTVCGTMAYSSPELLAGTRPYNPVATDVWAVGVVLFMMANNVAPFRDKTKEDMVKKQISKDYAFRKVLNRSESLKTLIASFLEPDVARRIRIKDAFQNIWIRSGNIGTPLLIHNANELVDNSRGTIIKPIITKNTLKLGTFHYEVSDQTNSISAFNEIFTEVEDPEEDIFRD